MVIARGEALQHRTNRAQRLDDGPDEHIRVYHRAH